MLDRLRHIKLAPFALALAAIMALAAMLRWSWPGVVEFKYDEAMISRRAIALSQHGQWPASTISSIPGIPQPPMKALLLAIPYAFTRDPSAAAVFQGLLGVITVGLTGWFGRRYFNDRVGLIAAGLLATAPWAIFYDRKLWSQNVPLLTLLMMIGLFGYVVERRAWLISFALLMLGALIGFYLGNVILAAVVGLGLALFPGATFRQADDPARRQTWAWLAIGAALLAITLIPFALELSAGRASPRAEARIADAPSFTLLNQIDLASAVGTGRYFHSLAGDRAAEYLASLPIANLSDWIDLPAKWIVVAGMLYVALRALRTGVGRSVHDNRLAATYGLLAMWVAVPIGVWTLTGMPAYTHRYIMLYPAQLLAAALLISDGLDLAASRWPSVKAALTGAIGVWLAVITIWHVIVFVQMMGFVSTHQISGGHGRPVSELWQVAQTARAQATSQSPIVIYSSGDDPEHDESAAQFDAVLGDFDLRLVADLRLALLPARDSIRIAPDGNGGYTVSPLPATPPSTEAGIARMDNGLDLVTVETPDGEAASFDLRFRVWADPPAGKNYGYSARIISSAANQLGSVDGPFLRSAYWRVGDTVLVTVRIPTDRAVADTDRLTIVLYAYMSETEIEGVNILDVAGNPAGQTIVVPLEGQP